MDLFWRLTDYEYRRMTVGDKQVKWLSVKGVRNKDDRLVLTPLFFQRGEEFRLANGQNWIR